MTDISIARMYGGQAPEGAGAATPAQAPTGPKTSMSIEEFTGKPATPKQKEETSMFKDILSAQTGMAEHLVAFWDKAAVGLNEATKNTLGIDLNALGERVGFMSTKQVAERAELLSEEYKKNEPKTIAGKLSTLPAYMATLYPQIVMAGGDMYEDLTSKGVDKKTATKAAAAATTTAILGAVVPYGRGLVAGAASGAGISIGALLGENKFMQYLLSGNYPKIAEEYKITKDGIIESGVFGLALGGVVGKLTGKSLKTPDAKKAIDLFADMAQEDPKGADAVVKSTEKVDPKLAKELQARIDEITISKRQVSELFTTAKKNAVARAQGVVTETDVKKMFDQSKRIATPETPHTPEQAVAETRNVMRAGYEATEVQTLPKEKMLEAMAEGMGSGIEKRTGDRKVGSQLAKLNEPVQGQKFGQRGAIGNLYAPTLDDAMRLADKREGEVGQKTDRGYKVSVPMSYEEVMKLPEGDRVNLGKAFPLMAKGQRGAVGDLSPQKNLTPQEAYAEFKKQTGDEVAVAKAKLAGIEARNAMRDSGNLKGEHEKVPYTKEQLQLLKRRMSPYPVAPAGQGTMPTETLWSIKDIDRNIKPKHEGYLDEVTRSIQKKGFDPKRPVTVTISLKDKMAYLTDGNNRVAAAKKLGIKDIPVKYETTGVAFTKEQKAKARPVEALGINIANIPKKVRTPQQQADYEELKKLLGEGPTNMYSGITITKEDIQRTFQLVKENVPLIATWEKELKDSYEVSLRALNPESLGPEAKRAAAITARAVARQAQADSAATKAAEARRAFWQSRGDDANLQFLYDFEKGKPLADPVLEAARKGYENEYAKINAFDEAGGIHYEARDNYLYHTFEDSEGVDKFFHRRYGAQWSDPKFTKQRGFELYHQAVAAGFRPRFTNPEDILLARQHASNIAAMRTETLEGMERLGLGRKVVKGQRPEVGETEWRAPTGQRYWVHDDASQILHNAFDTQSLWTAKGPIGSTFRGAMGLKNTFVPIKLAISGFHLLHVATIDNYTGMVRASKGLLAGSTSPGAWAKSMLRGAAFADTFKNPKAGGEIMRLWGKDASQLTGAEKTTLQYMFDGGFIPEMSSQWKIGALTKFQDALKAGNTVSAIARAPMAAVEAIQRPMFEVWIPRLKANAYIQDIKTAMEANPELVHNEKMRIEAFRKIAKSVDNRYGEMAYNTLFMNRAVKDTLVASSLSMGWWLGFLREYGGAGMDMGKAVTSKTGLSTLAKQGDLDRALFVGLYTAGSLMLGGMLTYGATGQVPQGWKDYVYPKIGGKNPNGTDKRVSTMFYTREFGGIALHAQEEGIMAGIGQHIANKASPVTGVAKALWTNQDYFGNEISDPSSPAFQQLQQKLMFTFKEMEPISVGAARKGETFEDKALPFLGLNPAPGYANETPAEAKIKSMFHKYHTQVTPYAQAQLNAERRDLKALYRAGDAQGYQQKLREVQEMHHLSNEQVQKIRRGLAGRGNRDAVLSMFKQLSAEEQLKILKTMAPEERQKYLRAAHPQARRALQ